MSQNLPDVCPVCKTRHSNACPVLWGGNPERPVVEFNDDQLTRDIRAHITNHPGDNAFAVHQMLRNADRDVSLIEVRDAWRRAKLLDA